MLIFEFAKITEFSDLQLVETYSQLSEPQRLYVDGLTPKKRIQSLCARALLNKLLIENTHNTVSQLAFDESGKPIILNSDLFVSLTHSYEYVGCALSDILVGIDIERVREVKQTVISRVCSSEEIDYINKNGTSHFFTFWTLKEAYIKANSSKLSKISDISFVKDSRINDNVIFDELDGYKWAIITL